MKMFISILIVLTTFWNSENHMTHVENDKFPLIGSWVNEDVEGGGITKCNIDYKKGRFAVHIWGACHPQDCDWGEQMSNPEKKVTEEFNFLWDHKFVERDMTFEIIDEKLKITTISHYKDNSGRPTRTDMEYFIKE